MERRPWTARMLTPDQLDRLDSLLLAVEIAKEFAKTPQAGALSIAEVIRVVYGMIEEIRKGIVD